MRRVNESVVSKWIPDLKPDTPLVDGARRVLGLRLRAVGETYRLAVRMPEETIEHVHQLRVATRRCGAALEAFANCLPGRQYLQAKKILRRLRRRAGDARDWDVFLEKLALKDTPAESTRILEGFGLAHRLPAQRRLEEACPDFPFDFERVMTETLGALQAPTGPGLTFGEQGHLALEAILGELALEMDKRDTDYEQLHQVRIVGKKLRYAMEIFVDCHPREFRGELYPLVEEMQEILGEVNDHHNAVAFYRTLTDDLPRVCPQSWRVVATTVKNALKEHAEGMVEGRKRYADWKRRWKSPTTRELIRSLIQPASGHMAG